jgi:prevent-host-death family protein
MSKTLPISEVKARLPELVTGVAEREEEVVVTRNGKPAAVLLNYTEYERLKETLDVLTDPDLMRQIRQSRKFYAKGRRGQSFEDVFDEPLVTAKKRRR